MCYALHFISLNCLIVAVVVVRFGQFWRRRRRRLDFVNGWENFLILTTSTSVTTTLWNVILKLAAYESFFSLNLAADEREREKEIFCLNFYSPSLSLSLSLIRVLTISLSHFLSCGRNCTLSSLCSTLKKRLGVRLLSKVPWTFTVFGSKAHTAKLKRGLHTAQPEPNIEDLINVSSA